MQGRRGLTVPGTPTIIRRFSGRPAAYPVMEFRMRLARHGLVGVACFALAAVAYAQSTAVAVPDNAPVQTAPLDDKPATWGDAKAGQAKAGACAACHVLDGNAMQQSAPRIAGMPERYIAQQLAMFKHGERTTGLCETSVAARALDACEAVRGRVLPQGAARFTGAVVEVVVGGVHSQLNSRLSASRARDRSLLTVPSGTPRMPATSATVWSPA